MFYNLKRGFLPFVNGLLLVAGNKGDLESAMSANIGLLIPEQNHLPPRKHVIFMPLFVVFSYFAVCFLPGATAADQRRVSTEDGLYFS